ncbi:MAG: hypothetical protein J7K40_02995 [candidate division Zixibacteria bacterium]|nr:hypothetical protein [candidate division Zixibacteria bacterium]
MKLPQLLITSFMGFIGIIIIKHCWEDLGLYNIVSLGIGIVLVSISFVSLFIFMRKIPAKKFYNNKTDLKADNFKR